MSTKFFKFITTTALLAVAGSAFAADGGLHAFTPPPGDAAVDVLAQIFGSSIISSIIGGGDGGANDTVLGSAMRVFNGAVLFLGMIFVGYTTIKGTLDSAHDGVLLGRKMSSLWVPLRNVGSTAFLLPLSSSGYSLIQITTLWLCLQGIGMADAVWSATMSSLQRGNTLAPVSVPSARSLAASILRSEVCMEAYNAQIKAGGGNDPLVKVVRSTQTLSNTGEINGGGVAGAMSPAYGLAQLASSTANSVYSVTTYSWASDGYVNKDICGSLSWTESAQSAMGAGDANVAKTPILNAQSRAVEQLLAELQPVAAGIVSSGGKLPAPGVLEQAAARYEQTIAKAASQAVAQGPEAGKTLFESYAKDAGWLYAGTWYNSILRYQNAVQSSVNTLPVTKPVALDPAAQQIMIMMPGYSDFMNKTEEYIKDRSAAPQAAVDAETMDASQIRSADDAWRLLSAPVLSLVSKTTKAIAGANTSPLLQMQSLGNDLVSAGVAVKGIQFTVAGLAGSRAADWTIGNAFNVSRAFETTYDSIRVITNGLWVAGVILAYYLPAMPFIYWITAVARYFISVCEAVLASPLMAVFMAAEGHDVVGRSGPGMLLLLSVIITPTLLLFGLIFSISLMSPLAGVVNNGFLLLVSQITGSGFLGLFGYMAVCVLYAVIMVTVIHFCLALVHGQTATAVIRWVASQAGADGAVQGEQANRQLNAVANMGGQMGAVSPQQGGGSKQGRDGGESTGVSALGKNGVSNADLISGPRD